MDRVLKVVRQDGGQSLSRVEGYEDLVISPPDEDGSITFSFVDKTNRRRTIRPGITVSPGDSAFLMNNQHDTLERWWPQAPVEQVDEIPAEQVETAQGGRTE